MNPKPARSPVRGQGGLLRLAWPLMISFTARSLLTAVDLPYGALIGDEAVAAIGLAYPLEFMFIACWVGLSASLTSHLSRAMGERHEGRLLQMLATARRIVLGLSALFLLLAAAVGLGADLLDLPPKVIANFRIYAPLILVGAGLVGFWSILPDSLIKAHHDMRTTMVAGLLSGLLNLGLNTLFVLGFGWGIWGIGLATALGRLGGLLYSIYRSSRLENERRLAWKQETKHKTLAARASQDELTPAGVYARPYRALLWLGVPSSLTFILMALEGGAVFTVLSMFPAPTAAIAAFTIYNRVFLLMIMPVVATGVALLPFIARRLGEGRVADVRRGLWEAFGFGLAYSVLVSAPVCLLLGTPLANFLGQEEATRQLAAQALQYAAPLGVLVAAPFMLCRPAFEAVQRGIPGLVMAALRYCLLSIPLALTGAWLFQQRGWNPFAGLLVGLISGTALTSLVFIAWLIHMVRGLEAGVGAGSQPGLS